MHVRTHRTTAVSYPSGACTPRVNKYMNHSKYGGWIYQLTIKPQFTRKTEGSPQIRGLEKSTGSHADSWSLFLAGVKAAAGS